MNLSNYKISIDYMYDKELNYNVRLITLYDISKQRSIMFNRVDVKTAHDYLVKYGLEQIAKENNI